MEPESNQEHGSHQSHPLYWVIGGLALVSLVFMVDNSVLDGLKSLLRLDQPALERCQDILRSQATVSRAQLSQLLAVPAQTRREHLTAILQTPYCRLSPVTTAEGLTLERYAYPLEFDLSVWLVVRYHQDAYIDYDFSFR